MKYVSIDIETTGLDPETCQIIQIGAVIEDTLVEKPIDQLPSFQCLVEHSQISGSPFALKMNAGILEKLGELERADRKDRSDLRKRYNIIPPSLVAKSFKMWLASNGFDNFEDLPISITAAGKNFATFDKLFLQKLPSWGTAISIKQRVIDPAILFMDWQNDQTLPNLKQCMERAGIDGEVTHDALQDAIDVVRVVRAARRNKN
jgi:DNA polymerase III alpha subunit (gram-positive type)